MNMVQPYTASVIGATGATASQYYVVGYKGTTPYDARLFYCPYDPFQMVRAVGENSFQPKIGFKTRYGLSRNPFAEQASAFSGADTAGAANSNVYYRRAQVNNLM